LKVLPDIVLLDHKLPDISGIEVLERMKPEIIKKDLSIVVLGTSVDKSSKLDNN